MYSVRSLSNANRFDVLACFDSSISRASSQPAPSEKSLHKKSPEWLDEQLEAALDQNGAWRSGSHGSSSPSHFQDQALTVPVYSPGPMSPVRIIPDYLVWRQEVLESAKREAERKDVESQSAFDDSLNYNSSDSDSQNHHKSGGNDSLLENQHPRTTRDFQRYFSSRIRLLGLEDCEFASLSETEKQIVMFHYGNAKVTQSRQNESLAETSKPRQDVLSLNDFIQNNSPKYPEKMHEVEQAWQKYGVTVTEATLQRQIERSRNDVTTSLKDSSLRNRAFRQPERCTSELSSRQTDTDDVFMTPSPSPSLQRRPSALWLFPKPTIPNHGAMELDLTYESSTSGLDEYDESSHRMQRQERHLMRRVLSFPTRSSAGLQSITNNNHELSQRAAELHPSAPALTSSQTDDFESPSRSQSSLSPPSPSEPSSLQSIRVVKRRPSLRQLSRIYSSIQNKAPGAAPGIILRHRASSADIDTHPHSSSTATRFNTGGHNSTLMDDTALLSSDASHKSLTSVSCEDNALPVIGEEMAEMSSNQKLIT